MGIYRVILKYTELKVNTAFYSAYTWIDKLNIGILSFTEFYWVIQAYG